MQHIAPNDFTVKANRLWTEQGLALTSGDFKAGEYNTMTVGWGFCGIMWAKPVVMVIVRPTRFTFGFMNRYETFTLCAFPPAYKKDLGVLGTVSGREGNKIARTVLTPVQAESVAAPVFAEAELVFECKIIYHDDFNPARFMDKSIHDKYPGKDYHRCYYGEILAIRGEDKYCS